MNRILHKRVIPLGILDTVVRSRGPKPSLLISNMLMVHGIAFAKEPPDALGIFDRYLSAPQVTRFNTFGIDLGPGAVMSELGSNPDAGDA